ncbi:MAG: methionyl-tRNA formyltransferase [Armatimonadota bacterium]|nr:methionyl-tRNA formyltransferase [Armatimonadota bacterium]
MRLAFFGTSAFAVPALLSLADHVDLVVTQPRRPSGRGNKLLPTPVGEAAAQLGIDTLSPEKAKEESFVEVIEARAFDAMVVASYGQILSGRLLAASKRGGINLHASLLPQYRGAAPINHAILAGDTESGVTLMQMDRGMDTGDIIAQETIPIGTDETVGDLEMRLATLAAEMAAAWMPKIVSGDYSRVPQDHALATIAPKIKIADMLISFDESAETAYLRYRAFTPKPGARVTASGGRIKILRCRLGSEVGDPGTLLERHDSGIEVAFATGSLILESLQPDNKGPVSGNDYANGRRLVKGDRL